MAVAVVTALIVGLLVGMVASWRVSRSRMQRWSEELLAEWRDEETESIQQATLGRSRAVLKGRVFEQVAPLDPDFGFDPADARFIGSPVDFVVFDGLTAARSGQRQSLRSIVFLDVKTGGSTLTTVQRRVRDSVQRGDVSVRFVPRGVADD